MCTRYALSSQGQASSQKQETKGKGGSKGEKNVAFPSWAGGWWSRLIFLAASGDLEHRSTGRRKKRNRARLSFIVRAGMREDNWGSAQSVILIVLTGMPRIPILHRSFTRSPRLGIARLHSFTLVYTRLHSFTFVFPRLRSLELPPAPWKTGSEFRDRASFQKSSLFMAFPSLQVLRFSSRRSNVRPSENVALSFLLDPELCCCVKNTILEWNFLHDSINIAFDNSFRGLVQCVQRILCLFCVRYYKEAWHNISRLINIIAESKICYYYCWASSSYRYVTITELTFFYLTLSTKIKQSYHRLELSRIRAFKRNLWQTQVCWDKKVLAAPFPICIPKILEISLNANTAIPIAREPPDLRIKR